MCHHINLDSGRKRDNKDIKSGAEALIDLMIESDIFQQTNENLSLLKTVKLEKMDQHYQEEDIPSLKYEITSEKSLDSILINVRINIQFRGNKARDDEIPAINKLIEALRNIGFSKITAND